MLEPDEDVFPNNVVKWIAAAMDQIDPDVRVFKRPLRNSDPQQSIGVSAQMWAPDISSHEMQGLNRPGIQLPTLQQYTLSVQAFVRDSTEERGLAVHSYMAQRVRSVLYTDADLQLVLGQLSVDLPGNFRESMKRWGVNTARYFSGEIDSNLLYLSTLEFWIETETRHIN